MKTLTVDKIASKGFAAGKAYIIEKQDFSADQYRITPNQADSEIEKFEKALKETKDQLEKSSEYSDIFKAHRELADDISLYEGVIRKIRQELMNAQLALEKTIEEFCTVFDGMSDEYMKERSADIKDIRNRIMSSLKGLDQTPYQELSEKVIILAKNLVPSDMIGFNPEYVMGLATELGSITSHVSIIARNLELPALVGIKDLMANVKNGDFIILDAVNARLIINPEEEVIREYQKLKAEYRMEKLSGLNTLPASTPDGRSIKLCANAGSLEEVKKAVVYHIDGIGLFRSEFLYMQSPHFPTEEELFAVYKEAAVLCRKNLTIRTLDIGGDKNLPYFPNTQEDNPFLGWRGIRVTLGLKEVFRTQLRAILRASAFGNIKIMYPMITSLEELYEANALLADCKNELDSEGISYNRNIKVGIMVETPAAVLCAGDLAKYSDFFSIGTNDLTQYLLAVDRGNPRVSDLYNSFHPAVIKSIKYIIDAAHANSIKVSVCGEFAGDGKAAVLLLGLGIDELSMPSGETAGIKDMIRNFSYASAKKYAEKTLTAQTAKEVRDILSEIN